MLPVVPNPSSEAESPILQRIAISLQYEGSFFCGWQRQTQGRGQSVQAVLEKAIAALDPHRPIKAIAAGRTDAGVHALGQSGHFYSKSKIDNKFLFLNSINYFLQKKKFLF